MKHTTAETTGRADPVYAMTLALLDQIENVTAELHRERSAQDEAFRDFKHACDREYGKGDNARIEAETQLGFAREEIVRLKEELANLKLCASNLREYAEMGQKLVFSDPNCALSLLKWANVMLPTAPATQTKED